MRASARGGLPSEPQRPGALGEPGAAGAAGAAGATPLRVAYYVAYPQRLGGGTRSLLALIDHLPLEVEPHMVVPAEGGLSQACRGRALPLSVLTPGPDLLRFGKVALGWSRRDRARIALTQLVPYTLRLARLLRRLRADVLHANDPRAALLAAPAAKLLGLPVVGHLRGQPPYGGLYLAGFERLSDRIVTVCRAIQADLSPRGRRKAVAIYNGTEDLQRSQRPGPSLAWLSSQRAQGQLVVGCFASLTPFKGQHHLVRALGLLRQRSGLEPLTLCVGACPPEDSAYGKFLEEEVRRVGLASVTFAGWQHDPLPLYAQCDVAVLPSVHRERLELAGRTLEIAGNEGFPRTHLEAMAMGLPVIGTAISGVPEQVAHGQTGLLVPPGDPAALSQALERLLTDPQERARMGQAGRARVLERFSTAAHVRAMVELYRELVPSRRRSASARTRPPAGGSP